MIFFSDNNCGTSLRDRFEWITHALALPPRLCRIVRLGCRQPCVSRGRRGIMLALLPLYVELVVYKIKKSKFANVNRSTYVYVND
jgi:hypothetical protein